MPNPLGRGRRGRRGLRRLRPSSPPGVAAAQVIGRAPLFTRLFQPTFFHHTFAQNLLLTTMAVVVATAPFSPARASMPDRLPIPGYTHVLHTIQGLNLSTLSNNSGIVPFTQDDWPNPTIPQPRLHPFAGLNLSMLSAASTVVPFTQLSWPNPALPPQGPPPISGLNVSLLPAASTVVPVVQLDWPNPVRPQPPIHPVSQGLNLSLVPITTAAQPFNIYDWPNPIRPPTVLPPISGLNLSLQPVVSLVVPFSQQQWPNPWNPREQVQYPVSGLNLSITPFVVPVPVSSDAWVGRRDHPTRKAWPLPPPQFPVEEEPPALLTLGETPQTALVPEWIQTVKRKPRGTYRGLVYRPSIETPAPTPVVRAIQKPMLMPSNPIDETPIRRKRQQRQEDDLILALLMQDAL